MTPSRVLLWLSALSVAAADFVTGQLGDAAQNLDNPKGAAYYAALPSGTGIEGSILASTDDGLGANFEVNFANLPAVGGPFLYHIHAYPVPADGNCTGTLGHLDPYIRGETPACDASMPATCQVGDLSGKHGTINGTTASLSYHDPYVSLQPGLGAFFGNRSFVLHFANTTRIACANFSYIGEGVIGHPGSSSSSGNSTINTNGTTTASGVTSTVSELVTTTSTSTVTGSTITTMTTKSSTGTGTASPAQVTTNDATRILQESPLSWLLLLTILFVFSL